MRAFMAKQLLLIVILAASAGTAFSADGLVSTKQNVPAYFDYYGYAIRPIGTTVTPGDEGPTQLFEVVRPSSGGITLGRLYTSCTCIQATTSKRNFGAGESVILTVRNVLPTTGETYPFFVQVTSPVRMMLRYDAYVISDKFASNPVNVSYVESALEQTSATPDAGGYEVIAARDEDATDSAGISESPENELESVAE